LGSFCEKEGAPAVAARGGLASFDENARAGRRPGSGSFCEKEAPDFRRGDAATDLASFGENGQAAGERKLALFGEFSDSRLHPPSPAVLT
jgi:hypothetical protein